MKKTLRSLFFLGFILFHVSYLLPSAPLLAPTGESGLQLFSYEKRDSLRSLVLEAIASAKKSLSIATFTLTDPEVIEAIRAASERGVNVSIAVDKKGFHGKRGSVGKKSSLSLRPVPGLMHQKWIIVDEELSLIGSANLTQTALCSQHNLIVAIESKTFAKQLLEEAKKKRPSYTHPIGATWKTPLPPYRLSSWTSPKNPALKEALLKAIEEARESIEIALFTFTHQELLASLIDAKERGVAVKVMLDRHQALGASYRTLLRLMQEGVPVALSHGKALLHHKFAWIDRKQLFMGSFNWTKAALTQNEELLTLIEGGTADDPFWSAVKATWDRLEESVEWQKHEDWSDRAWEDGQSPKESSGGERREGRSDPLPLAA